MDEHKSPKICVTPNHRRNLRSLAREEQTRVHRWSDKTYQAQTSPGAENRNIPSSSVPTPPRRLQAHTPLDGRVPEISYSQVFQAAPTSKARVEVIHHDGKVKIKSSDLDLHQFKIEQHKKGWVLSFEIFTTPKGTPESTPQVSPSLLTRALRNLSHGATPPTSPSNRLRGPDRPSRGDSRGLAGAGPKLGWRPKPDAPTETADALPASDVHDHALSPH
jgi:hypothetical protein